jgi:hypothetical protein
VGSSLDLFTYDTDEHILRRLTNPGIADVLDISWSTDGKKLFYINGVELVKDTVSIVGNYKLFTLNSQGPTDSSDQGIRTFYTGRKRPYIVWKNENSDLIFYTKKYYACVSGSTEVTLIHLNLSTGKSNVLRPESFLFHIAVDPMTRVVLFDVRKDLSSYPEYYLVDFSGNIIHSLDELLGWCHYLGGPSIEYLCSSWEGNKLFGITLEGKLEEIADLSTEILDLEISPKGNWFIVEHLHGIDIYSKNGVFINHWPAADRSAYLWARDENGLYFIYDQKQLYYWSFTTSDPMLMYECRSSELCFGGFLAWTN